MAQSTADNPTLQDSGFDNHQLKIMRPLADPNAQV
ncbi:hypothetical protein NIES4072_70980 [Nostoc commune NIES-4072]|uniref:Uncharacterized protein n=1 Tax=Nostoc commune NIES-4072 TaxID=2005467 RepID=A0A2R5FX91_NOSCO|nr:hypothetical protein NIES4070_71430 [Nostoc commune HK-02]GBG23386.1 hypothetical protein NIES4072_70980 [Nostoc commune NIES-4072]